MRARPEFPPAATGRRAEASLGIDDEKTDPKELARRRQEVKELLTARQEAILLSLGLLDQERPR